MWYIHARYIQPHRHLAPPGSRLVWSSANPCFQVWGHRAKPRSWCSKQGGRREGGRDEGLCRDRTISLRCLLQRAKHHGIVPSLQHLPLSFLHSTRTNLPMQPLPSPATAQLHGGHIRKALGPGHMHEMNQNVQGQEPEQPGCRRKTQAHIYPRLIPTASHRLSTAQEVGTKGKPLRGEN